WRRYRPPANRPRPVPSVSIHPVRALLPLVKPAVGKRLGRRFRAPGARSRVPGREDERLGQGRDEQRPSLAPKGAEGREASGPPRAPGRCCPPDGAAPEGTGPTSGSSLLGPR